MLDCLFSFSILFCGTLWHACLYHMMLVGPLMFMIMLILLWVSCFLITIQSKLIVILSLHYHLLKTVWWFADLANHLCSYISSGGLHGWLLLTLLFIPLNYITDPLLQCFGDPSLPVSQEILDTILWHFRLYSHNGLLLHNSNSYCTRDVYKRQIVQ